MLQLGALDGVAVHADVPSVEPYYEAARVVVVPLRSGTGTRLKALEAMAAGRPVVGTSIGLEGIGVTDRKQLLIADDAASFADGVIELLRDDDLARAWLSPGAHTSKSDSAGTESAVTTWNWSRDFSTVNGRADPDAHTSSVRYLAAPLRVATTSAASATNPIGSTAHSHLAGAGLGATLAL